MVDLDRHAALRPDGDRLVDGLEQLIRLGAHVRDVDAAVRRHRLRHLDQLVGGGVVAGRVDQRRPDAERTVFHRAPHDRAHAVEFGRARPADRLSLRIHAHRRCTDERSDVGRRAVCLHRVEPRLESVRTGIGAGALRPTGRELTAGRGLLVGGRRRAALTEDLGRDPLRHLAHRPAVTQKAGAALDVDEAGRHDEPAHVEALFRREPTERSGGPDSRDPVADDGDVPEEPGGAGAVHDAPVLEDQVELRLRTRCGGRWLARAGGEDEAGSNGVGTNHRSGCREERLVEFHSQGAYRSTSASSRGSLTVANQRPPQSAPAPAASPSCPAP